MTRFESIGTEDSLTQEEQPFEGSPLETIRRYEACFQILNKWGIYRGSDAAMSSSLPYSITMTGSFGRTNVYGATVGEAALGAYDFLKRNDLLCGGSIRANAWESK